MAARQLQAKIISKPAYRIRFINGKGAGENANMHAAKYAKIGFAEGCTSTRYQACSLIHFPALTSCYIFRMQKLMYKNKTVCVVVPAYNEETQIANVIKTMPAYVDKIVVVNDCSRDKTAAVVEALQPQFPAV